MVKKKVKKKTRARKQIKGQKKVQKKKVVKSKKVVRKKKVEKSFFNWSFFLIVLLLLCFSFLSFLIFLFVKNYQNWEKEFPNSEVLILDFENEVVDLDEKIIEYNENREEYAFIEFSKEESLFLLSQSLNESLPDWVKLEKTGLFTLKGVWSFYIKTKVWNFELPWFEILLFKNNVQSIEIYVEDIFLGNLSFRNIGLYSVVEKINEGFTKAMRLVNDGNFAGRVFENIELGEDSLIVKSRNISL